jgi:nucleoside-diphosphate-sugar epimerase
MILITGGLGFLGVNLAKYLLDLGEEVLLTRHRNPRVPDILAPFLGKTLLVAPMDVTDLAAVMDAVKKYKVTSMVHAASLSEGRGSLCQVLCGNLIGSANVLEAARLMDVGRVTFIRAVGVLFYYFLPTAFWSLCLLP